MEKRKKVSVILTTHNRIGSLIVAIDSVLNQSYDNIEIIVVNDFDKDNDNLIAKFESYNLKLLHSNSTGANAARLLGFQNATGHFVSFLDDDDYWVKDKIKNQVDSLEKNNDAILVTSNARVFYENGNLGEIIYGKSNPKFLDYANLIGGFSFPCIKREFIKESYFLEGLESGQDWYLWLLLRDNNLDKNFIDTNTIEIFYRKSSISITKSKNNKVLGFGKVYNYLKPSLRKSAINWHRYNKSNEYKLGKASRFKLFSLVLIDLNYMSLLLYFFKQKTRKLFFILK
jgi:glycosyltransferase involved in cell wall biosynthesis